MHKKIAFIGVGNMAGAIISGITSSSNPIDFNDIVMYDTNKNQTARFTPYGAYDADSIENAVSLCDCVVLSVKPQNYPEVLADLGKIKNADKKLYISIGAGIPMSSVTDAVGNVGVVRVLPNTPMLIGMGVSAMCRNSFATDDDFDFVRSIFEATGKVIVIDESEMNRIISVTSSSPAYVFLFIKAIYEGALSQGLETNGLLSAVCDTVIGSAQMLKESQKTPEELIQIVASKGGTTERALGELNNFDFSKAIISAMKKCTDRADELGSVK